ncbi:MAG: GTP cyclohydrolase II [Gammaproteobacteria bacterium]
MTHYKWLTKKTTNNHGLVKMKSDHTKNIVSIPADESSANNITLSEVAKLPTSHGHFEVRVVKDSSDTEHVIIYKGTIENADILDVRVHSECLTGEVFASLRCDCDQQLGWALNHIETLGTGMVIYLRQEGRGIGLFNKIRAYALQDTGLDTVEANQELGFPSDLRTYEVAADILNALGVSAINLITNNPRKVDALQKHGIDIKRRIPILIEPNDHNRHYLRVKGDKLKHLF